MFTYWLDSGRRKLPSSFENQTYDDLEQDVPLQKHLLNNDFSNKNPTNKNFTQFSQMNDINANKQINQTIANVE